MPCNNSVNTTSNLLSALKTGAVIFTLAGMLPFTLPAAASEDKSHAAAGSHKGSAKPGEPAARSRVFGSVKRTHKPAAHPPKTAATDHRAPAHSVSQPAKSKSGHAGHWGYAGKNGPDHWGDLKKENALCSAGRMQSPVNVTGGLAVKAPGIKFNYKMSDLTIRNNGHTVQVDYRKGSYILVSGRRFDLLQFHFHTPSEHLVDGKKYPLEMHLVHKDAGGQLAVVGVMMETGARNIALAEIWNHLPEAAGKPAPVSAVAVNARDLLPENGNYHHYKGSLTTPPCSEGVNWFVLAKPLQVSAAQIRKISDIMGDNARPAQSIQNRLVITGR